MEEAVCCTQCHSVGLKRYIRNGSVAVGLIMLAMFLLPGILYFIWFLFEGHWGCSTCGSRRVVLIDDPDVLRAKGLMPQERVA